MENITIIDPMGQRFDSPYSVNVSTDTSTGNYTCELDTESPCGGTIGMLNLAIYGKPNAFSMYSMCKKNFINSRMWFIIVGQD